MISEWEQEQEDLIRGVSMTPRLDDRLRTRVLLEAGLVVRRRRILRRVAIAAGLLLTVGTMSLFAHVLLAPDANVVAENVNGQSEHELDDALDRHEKQSKQISARTMWGP